MARERGQMPAHIHALHVALDEATERREKAEEALAKTLDAHIAEYDRIQSAIDQAASGRANAYYDQRNCFDAIKKMGFYVEPSREPQGFSLHDDKEAARARARPHGGA